jgi:outer membrane lipoprotein-sorting protein
MPIRLNIRLFFKLAAMLAVLILLTVSAQVQAGEQASTQIQAGDPNEECKKCHDVATYEKDFTTEEYEASWF